MPRWGAAPREQGAGAAPRASWGGRGRAAAGRGRGRGRGRAPREQGGGGGRRRASREGAGVAVAGRGGAGAARRASKEGARAAPPASREGRVDCVCLQTRRPNVTLANPRVVVLYFTQRKEEDEESNVWGQGVHGTKKEDELLGLLDYL
eukprot:XP_020393592.1 H/ACA ribonucleoprotein complex subunit 1-like [Zea mays]